MDSLKDENAKLKEQLKILEEENLVLKDKYNKYKNRVFSNNVKKIYQIFDLQEENEKLRKQLEEKYENCLLEKQNLKEEINELNKLLSNNHDQKRKKTENSTYCY